MADAQGETAVRQEEAIKKELAVLNEEAEIFPDLSPCNGLDPVIRAMPSPPQIPRHLSFSFLFSTIPFLQQFLFVHSLL
jgi:hypothetical protein